MDLINEAELEATKSRVGNLEEIRSRLGLSRRKICQLLLVDPSAWTRWTRPGGRAPAHVYRSLEWYLALVEKHPALGKDFQNISASQRQEDLRRLQELEKTLGQLRRRDKILWLVLGLAVAFQLATFFLARP